MGKKKQKQKWSGNRPVMFYQDGTGNTSQYGPRVRIFYPDGQVVFSYVKGVCVGFGEIDDLTPCFLRRNRDYSNSQTIFPKTIKQAIRIAAKFDRESGFPEMEFLGEL